MHRTWDFREDDVEELKQAAAVQASDARGEGHLEYWLWCGWGQHGLGMEQWTRRDIDVVEVHTISLRTRRQHQGGPAG
jgi:hypothetical protein